MKHNVIKQCYINILERWYISLDSLLNNQRKKDVWKVLALSYETLKTDEVWKYKVCLNSSFVFSRQIYLLLKVIYSMKKMLISLSGISSADCFCNQLHDLLWFSFIYPHLYILYLYSHLCFRFLPISTPSWK